MFGKYHQLIFETDTTGFDQISSVRLLNRGDLEDLERLDVTIESETRLAAGDLCCGVVNREATIVGLQWVNVNSHVDTYLGPVSRPTPARAFINQTKIDATDRGRGFGRTLMVGTLGICNARGIEQVRLTVDSTNTPMIRLCQSLGFECKGHQYGARLGNLTLRITKSSA